MQKINIKHYLLILFMPIFSSEVERIRLTGNEISKEITLSLTERAIENKLLELGPQELHDRLAFIVNSQLATSNIIWLPRIPFRAYEILDLMWKYCDTTDEVTHDILDVLHAGCYNNDLNFIYYLSEMYRRKAFFSDVTGKEQLKLNNILAKANNPIALIKIESKDKDLLEKINISATKRYLENYKYDQAERLKNIENAERNIYNMMFLEDPEYLYCLANSYLINNQKHLAYIIMQKSAEYGHPDAAKHLNIFESEENIIHNNEQAKESFYKLISQDAENLLIKNHANKTILDNEDKILEISTNFKDDLENTKQNMLKSNILGLSDLVDYYIRTGYQISKDEEEEIIKKARDYYIEVGFENFGPKSDNSNKLSGIFLLTRSKLVLETALKEKEEKQIEQFIDELGSYFIRNPQNKYLYDYLNFDGIINLVLDAGIENKDTNIALKIGQLKSYIDKRSEALEIFSKLEDNCEANFLEACMLMSKECKPKSPKDIEAEFSKIASLLENAVLQGHNEALIVVSQKYNNFKDYFKKIDEINLAKMMDSKLKTPITESQRERLESAFAHLIINTNLKEKKIIGYDFSVYRAQDLLKSSINNYHSKMLLANMYIKGLHVRQDIDKAAEIIKDQTGKEFELLKKEILDLKTPGYKEFQKAAEMFGSGIIDSETLFQANKSIALNFPAARVLKALIEINFFTNPLSPTMKIGKIVNALNETHKHITPEKFENEELGAIASVLLIEAETTIKHMKTDKEKALALKMLERCSEASKALKIKE